MFHAGSGQHDGQMHRRNLSAPPNSPSVVYQLELPPLHLRPRHLIAEQRRHQLAKLLCLALLALLVTCSTSVLAGICGVAAELSPSLRVNDARDGEPQQLLRWPMVLHQTVPTLNLTAQEAEWQRTWTRLGVKVRLADDARCRDDIIALSRATGERTFLRAYDALETGVQRSDMWRYAVLFLHGGVYADIDVVARPAMAALLSAPSANHSAIVFVESLPSPRLVGWAIMQLGLTDMVRIPQYRNCLMVSRRGHPAMRASLDTIVAQVLNGRMAAPVPVHEPAHTLELTGPGVYTDAVRAVHEQRTGGDVSGSRRSGESGDGERWSSNDRSQRSGRRGNGTETYGAAGRADDGEPPMLFVSRRAGFQYFEHIGLGSWKTNREGGPGGSSQLRGSQLGHSGRGGLVGGLAGGTGGGRSLEEHEVRLLLLVLLVSLAPAAVVVHALLARAGCWQWLMHATRTSRMKRRHGSWPQMLQRPVGGGPVGKLLSAV